KTTFKAFEEIDEGDIKLTLYYNDGSIRDAYKNEADIVYENADSFRFDDIGVAISICGVTRRFFVDVEKAVLDLSEVHWSEGAFIYDGEEKGIEIFGLPQGVTIIGYEGNGEREVGEYRVGAIIEYDTENYEAPIMPTGIYTIAKNSVCVPILESLVYNGSMQVPTLFSDLYYTADEGAVGVGKYMLTLTLIDSKNYEFEGGRISVDVPFSIIPAPITIKLSNTEKYWFEKIVAPSFEVIEGEVYSSDELGMRWFVDGGRVSAVFDNDNYLVTVIDGVHSIHCGFSREGRSVFFIILIISVAVILTVIIIFTGRDKLKNFIAILRCPLSPVSKAPVDDRSAVELTPTTREEILSMDIERADGLISDSLAKDLVRSEGIVIETEGNKKRIINVDTLSESFSAGDRVDINLLKEKSLVPYDTAYIKVLARGMIDKPLTVYANDFSLSAVKMIALTGGEAVRVVTLRIKSAQGKIVDNFNENS
ncbi:MAG: uL15 family ribosomal protein, partial [Clostridia bacterium]|nr:uL15 family ribosomal protein [Clostridia bacterium]